MTDIFQLNQDSVPWSDYRDPKRADAPVSIRFKALTRNAEGVPPVQYIEYLAGHTDSVHSHETGELIFITDGELFVDGAGNGPGSIVFVAANTPYAFRAGDQGARFFRVVV